MDWKERADVFPLECEYWAGLGFGEEKKEEEEGEGEERKVRGVRRQRKERQEEEGERIWVFCFFLYLLDRKHTIPEHPPHVRGAQIAMQGSSMVLAGAHKVEVDKRKALGGLHRAFTNIISLDPCTCTVQ